MPMRVFAIRFFRRELECAGGVVSSAEQEVADAAYAACKVDMDRLIALPDGEDWDKDPFRELAAKIWGTEITSIDIAKRLYAKQAFMFAASRLDPDRYSQAYK